MSKGGNVCNRLKFIRKRLAEQNGIEYKVERCPNSDNCKEGTCPFCEKEADDLMSLLLEKEERGEKVIWDVSLDDYDISTLYGDDEFGKSAIPYIDSSVNNIDPSIIDDWISELPNKRMGYCDMSEWEVKDELEGTVQVQGLVDKPTSVNEDMALQGLVSKPDMELHNPSKTSKLPHFRTMDNPWFDIDDDSHNENQDSSISSEKPIEAVTFNDAMPESAFLEPMMGDVVIQDDMNPISDVKFMAVDNSDLMVVKTDIRDLDEYDFDDTLLALKHIHQLTGSKFSDTLNAYLREGKSEEKAIQYLTTFGGYEKVGDKPNMPEEKSENAEPRTILDDFVGNKYNPITVEAIRAVRQATSEGMAYCKKMLEKCGGDVDKAIDEIKKHPLIRPLMGSVKKDDTTEEN